MIQLPECADGWLAAWAYDADCGITPFPATIQQVVGTAFAVAGLSGPEMAYGWYLNTRVARIEP